MASVRLRHLIETHKLKDVWQGFYTLERQYSWSHLRENLAFLAKLYNFYCFKHHFNIFKACHIVPVDFTDHCLVHCSVVIQYVKTHSAYWHFNTRLLLGFLWFLYKKAC